MAIELQFLGAARHVTGSKHLITVDGRRILLDCGLVQGPRAMAVEANRELPFDPGSIDAVILSHAHIDHSGSLPRLVRMGYRGPIHCTPGTRDLAEILLADSAYLQAQDIAYLKKKGRADPDLEPPYDIEDVERTVRAMRTHGYGMRFEVLPGVRAEFLEAGHILGSAMVVVHFNAAGREQRLAFTGDHGRAGSPILRDPERLPEVDYLITESTYGDRVHETGQEMEEALCRVVREEVEDGGRILVPAFSVGRTQNLLYTLGNLIHAGRIPPQRIWVDSPLSTKATKIVAAHRELFDADARAVLESGRDPFFFDGVRFVADVQESMALNGVRSGIIISASGMCEAGRILHHLKFSVTRKEDCVLAVGFMAEGTLGRKLVDGFESVPILGERYPVRCKVRQIQGLSAHADCDELVAALRHLAPRCRRAFVVHGEEAPALKFCDRLRDVGFENVVAPVQRQKFVLN
jgi:metallo-beta-lactamase family protein